MKISCFAGGWSSLRARLCDLCCSLRLHSIDIHRLMACQYTRDYFLNQRISNCCGISRHLRRTLFHFKLLVRPNDHKCNEAKEYPICPRINRRKPRERLVHSSETFRRSFLLYPIVQNFNQRKSKRVILPSILLTNARSIRNKFDELRLRIKRE